MSYDSSILWIQVGSKQCLLRPVRLREGIPDGRRG